MFDRKGIRLIIYLVISIAVIIILWNLPKNEAKKEIQNKNEVVHVRLPENDLKESIKIKPIFFIYIDSLNNYRINDSVIELIELKERLTVQYKKDTNSKLFIEVDVHPRSNAEKFIDLVKLSEKLKIKIRIK